MSSRAMTTCSSFAELIDRALPGCDTKQPVFIGPVSRAMVGEELWWYAPMAAAATDTSTGRYAYDWAMLGRCATEAADIVGLDAVKNVIVLDFPDAIRNAEAEVRRLEFYGGLRRRFRLAELCPTELDWARSAANHWPSSFARGMLAEIMESAR
jgi:hypothetical protein